MERVVGPASVQDLGRAGFRAHGVPPGGALVPAWLVEANLALSNAPGAAGIERCGPLTLRAAGGPAWIAVDGRRLRLRDGERAAVPGPGAAAVGYVAVEGGLDVPVVLGGRGALPTGALPGLAGRMLVVGDELPVGAGGVAGGGSPPPQKTTFEPTAVPLDPSAPLRVAPGPDRDAFAEGAFEALLDGAWVIDRFDRTGHRLVGPALMRRDADVRVSAPTVRGCVQIPADGQPVIVGPDGPTLGGYPVLAVLLRDDAEALAARPPGAPVRFFAVRHGL